MLFELFVSVSIVILSFTMIYVLRTLRKNKAKKQYLKNLTVVEIKASYEMQKQNNDWTFYEEREFVENLLQTRFNFLITIYTLFLLSFIEANDQKSKIIILILGLIIVGIMGLAVYRVYIKFNIIMTILNELDWYHVFIMQRKELQGVKIKLFNVNPFIGFIIPFILFVSIIAMGIMLIFFNFSFN